MARARTKQGPGAEGSGSVCECCGGSGVLRTDSAAYRTCLECLGQGVKPRFSMVLGLSDRPMARGFQLSASTSGAR